MFGIKIGLLSTLGIGLGLFYISVWLNQFSSVLSQSFLYSSLALLTIGAIYVWSVVLVNLDTDLGEEYRRQRIES